MDIQTIGVSEELSSRLISLLGTQYVLLSDEEKSDYGSDQTEDYHFMPAVVVKPGNTAEVSAILTLANEYKVPVTPRGAGTGLSGGALPVCGGIVLSTERFNRILEIEDQIQKMGVRLGDFDQENEFVTIHFTLDEKRPVVAISKSHRIKVAFVWTVEAYAVFLGFMLMASLAVLIGIAVLEKLKVIPELVRKVGV